MFRSILTALFGALAILASVDSAHAWNCPTGMVSNVQATDGTSSSSVQVTWTRTAPAGSCSYIVFRVDSTSGPACTARDCPGWIRVTDPFAYVNYSGRSASFSHTDTTPPSAQTLTYMVCSFQSYLSDGTFDQLNCGEAPATNGWRAPPPAPTFVSSAAGSSTAHIPVTWSRGVILTNLTHRLYRSNAPSSCSNPGEVIANPLSSNPFNDTTATPGVSYYYTVQAVAPSGDVACTPTSQTWRKMSSPTNVLVEVADGDSLRVRWNHPTASGAPSNGVVSYNLYRRTNSSVDVCGSGQLIYQGITPGSASFQDDTVVPGTAYFYALRSAGANGQLSDCSSASSGSGTAPGFVISGRVVQEGGSVGLSGVALSLSGARAASTTSAADGTYSFTALAGGNYTVAAARSGVTIFPPSQGVSISSFDQTGVNFTASCPAGQFFSGQNCVVLPPGAPIGLNASDNLSSGVVVQWSAPSGPVTGYKLYRSSSSQACGSGTQIATVSGTSYSDTAINFGQAAFYSVRAYNAGGDGACSNIDQGLRTDTQPQITSGPANVSVFVGQAAVFNVVASGSRLSYQWKRNGSPISGANDSSYTLSPVALGDNGAQFSVEVSNPSFPAVASNAATLTVKAKPAITQQPQGGAVYIGETRQLSVGAAGEQMSYQWFKNGSAILGATNAFLDTGVFALSDDGVRYHVVVSNPGGDTRSNDAIFSVRGNTLSVSVSRAIGGGLSGAEISINSNSAGTTDANGLLSVANLAAGTYAVTAAKAGVQINPSSLQVSVVNGQAAQASFSASCQAGNVFDGSVCVPRTVFPIQPRLECVSQVGAGRFRAYFGYNNPNNGVVTVAHGAAIGARNELSDAALTAQLPTDFDRGLVTGAFSVEFNGSPLTWTLENDTQGAQTVSASSASPACAPVVPTAQCIRIAPDGTLMAHFGFQNANDFRTSIVVPLGERNGFTPAPQDRGQPVEFEFGNHPNAFSVPFDGATVTWSLLGQQVSLSRESQVCAPGNTAPVANAGVSYAASCQGYVTTIQLDAVASTDADGNRLFYRWTTTCPNASFSDQAAMAPTLQLRDPGLGIAANCSVSVTVTDNLLSSTASAPVSVVACPLDCRSIPNGTALIDQCGICGGDGTTCLDCRAIPNGPNRVDRCGVCGGNDACVDCNNVPNGPAARDRCGVCGGNGTSCLGCVETKLSDVVRLLTEDFFKLRDINARSLRRLRDAANEISAAKPARALEMKKYTKFVRRSLKDLDFRYARLQIELVAEIPSVLVTCENSTFCTQTDNGPVIDKYRTVAATMEKSTEEAMKRLRKLIKLTGTDTKRLANAKATRILVDNRLLTVPRVVSKCG